MLAAAAANASSHASTSALTTGVKAAVEASPASPFAQLLRSSRFATYDPLIRKTYYSPKQFVERGYWGLKRPITQRKKNSFITIKEWETRQHYVEWDNAEDQIRFLRRIEELNVQPGAQDKSRWLKQLGPAKSSWLMDSEFAPRDWNSPAFSDADEDAVAPPVAPPPSEINMESLGKQGPGQYGVNMTRNVTAIPDLSGQGGMPQYTKSPSAVRPNVASMSPAAFKRYLEKLRRLRPAFKEYLDRVGEQQKQENVERNTWRSQNPPKREHKVAGQTLLQVAQVRDTPFHRLFLAKHTESEYQSTTRIQPQPHRNGALMYSYPPMVNSLFFGRSKPGIILSRHTAGRFDTDKRQVITAFAGVAAVMDEKFAEGHLPLMDPGMVADNWPHAVTAMRPVTRSPLGVVSVPRVVGHDPQEGLTGVKITLQVTTKPGFDDPNRTNPHWPGSRQYVNHTSLDAPRASASATASNLESQIPPTQPMSSLRGPMQRSPLQPASTMYPYQLQTERDQKQNNDTLGVLQNLLLNEQGKALKDKGKEKDGTVPDSDL